MEVGTGKSARSICHKRNDSERGEVENGSIVTCAGQVMLEFRDFWHCVCMLECQLCDFCL